jgi:hypothetical protein
MNTHPIALVRMELVRRLVLELWLELELGPELEPVLRLELGPAALLVLRLVVGLGPEASQRHQL